MVICSWLFSLRVFSRFTHGVACVSTPFLLWLNNILCMNILHFVYPFIHRWIFRLFPVFYYCEKCCYEHSCITFCVEICFHFSWVNMKWNGLVIQEFSVKYFEGQLPCFNNFNNFICAFSRLWDLEKQIKQLRNYRDNYQTFCKWLYDAKRRQDSLESMKFGDSNTVMRFLNEQKVKVNLSFHSRFEIIWVQAVFSSGFHSSAQV